MVNTELISSQSAFLLNMHDTIQVTSYTGGHDGFGKRIDTTDPSKIRVYNCLIQDNEDTNWTVGTSTDRMPYVAYVLTVPVGGTDAYPIRTQEEMEVLSPSYLAGTIRRLGTIKTYPDQYGNRFVQWMTFE
jgi:hypothetical protein